MVFVQLLNFKFFFSYVLSGAFLLTMAMILTDNVLKLHWCCCVRTRQRYNSEPGDVQSSSYEAVHNGSTSLIDDAAVITAVARVC